MTCTVVYGPPGTGKTTHLLSLMESELAAGTPPDRIAFVSFTRNAVDEARARAAVKFRVAPRELRWFRTLHSLAYTALGLTRSSVMTDLQAFAASNGFTLGRSGNAMEAAFAAQRTDDKLFHAYQLTRATGLTMPTVAKKWRLDGISASRYEAFCSRLEAWKKENRLLDWADMIDEFVTASAPVPVEVAFIDEAQDLSAAQWRMIELAFRDARRVVVAGDDDQAIYEWGGADVRHMLKLPGEQTILTQSHRVPQALLHVANGIARRIRLRKHKQWAGTAAPGAFVPGASMAALPLENGERWLLLGRTAFQLAVFRKHLESRGVMFVENGERSVTDIERNNFAAHTRLLAGAALPLGEARRLLAQGDGADFLPATRVVAAHQLPAAVLPPERMFARWRTDRLRYVQRVAAAGALSAAPTVELSTVHGAKGSEAINVALSPDMSRAPALALRTAEYSDAEHRVWYVAATRAQRRLFLLRSESEYRYKMG